LSEDATRRRKEYEQLFEATLNQSKPLNLVSENSAKILLRKVMLDFKAAIYQVSQVYAMEDADAYEMSEE